MSPRLTKKAAVPAPRVAVIDAPPCCPDCGSCLAGATWRTITVCGDCGTSYVTEDGKTRLTQLADFAEATPHDLAQLRATRGRLLKSQHAR